MSDGLEIRGGGAVSVDTESLREAAGRFDRMIDDLDVLQRRFGVARAELADERRYGWGASGSAMIFAHDLDATIVQAAQIAGDLRHAAAVYELVELDAEHAALSARGDGAGIAAVELRRAELLRLFPGADAEAFIARFDRAVMWPSYLVRQATETGSELGGVFSELGAAIGGVALGGATLGTAVVFGVGGWGRLARDARLSGEPSAVVLRSTPPPPRMTTAPPDLASAAARMPGAGDARVRVEKYTMPDGTEQFAVYIAGTQSLGVGGDDPWDVQSNAELYTGSRSASYEATLAALEAAGAKPGDTVHAFGHSQGAMIAAHLALEGPYDMATMVSFGSPVEADVGAETLAVAIRHSDDPISMLAGGGHETAVGAPGSFTAEREAHADSGVVDATVPAHSMRSYAESAALVDASGDPRVSTVHEVFARLGRADAVAVTEYAASRPAPPAAGLLSPRDGAAAG
ncbi:hypothetical protein QSU92_09795 [Microbacterium sp. ET2]|uniref:hypothetical protein n=1 Tax=Microbacterium albipurpureum TaxID=3050384 RepID=UPI00259C89FD|nr:hypothetical protein [Microbacterium sp. ET2 (Ac-2212)]WJL94290.1 hypothetical protein QSU92_09795 [Microbacterium sp. ET2 (Ac-2212)]